MTITLHDPVRPGPARPLDLPPRPSRPEDDAVGERRSLPPLRDELHRRHVPPIAPGDDVRASVRARGGKGRTSFELASRGGYIRTVTGTIAYLDEEAETFMVLADGELLRVPLRDVTSRHEETAINELDRSSDRDAEGLGTG